MKKTQVNAYIDGFNLYHSTLQHTHPDFRWLNLAELAKQFINPEKEEIKDVYYFSALATWQPAKAKNHLLYMEALRAVGVKVVLGKFNEKNKKCPLCQNIYKTHEEKKTDINIAITLLADGIQNKFDTALIVSGDSDLSPVTTKLKELCPSKKVGIVIPQGQFAVNLRQKADFYKKLQTKDLRKSLLPETITYKNKVLTAPTGWLPISRVLF
jgi:uncharacterized LabA/DUF88 family protein